MKKILALILVATLGTFAAHARIGETFDQVTKRYGEGRKQNCDRLPGAEQYNFVKNPFAIEVILLDGKSVMEVVHRVEGPHISDDEIKELLKVNGDGHTWSLDRKDNQWMRNDHKVRAFHQPGHHDYFFIEDVAATKQARVSDWLGGGTAAGARTL